MFAYSKTPAWYQGRLRLFGWGGAVVLLSLPAVAMRAGVEGVDWSIADFLVLGIMLLVLGVGLECAGRRSARRTFRAASGLALFGNFALFWMNAAVGILGPESAAPNALFLLLPVIGAGGALLSRGGARTLSKTMIASALAQFGIGLLAILMATAAPRGSFQPILAVTACFTLLWLGAAYLFARAA